MVDMEPLWDISIIFFPNISMKVCFCVFSIDIDPSSVISSVRLLLGLFVSMKFVSIIYDGFSVFSHVINVFCVILSISVKPSSIV